MSTGTAPLDIVGVRVADPFGDIARDGDWINIGTLVQRDDVEVIPRRDASAAHLERLTAAAVQVWMHGRGVLGCWVHHPRLGWIVDVIVRDPEGAAERCESAGRYCLAGGVR